MNGYLWPVLMTAVCLVQASRLHSLRERHNHHMASDEGCKSANLRFPPGCEEDRCELVAQWSGRGKGRVEFSVSARLERHGSAWAALGLSADREHSDVVLCLVKEDSNSTLLSAHGVAGSKSTVSLHMANDSTHSGMQLISAQFKGKQLECSFILTRQFGEADLTKPLYVLLGSGHSESSWHALPASIKDVFSPECELDVSSCTSSCEQSEEVDEDVYDWVNMLLVKLHGVAMIVSFVLLLPTGVLVARYYQLVLADSWFLAHRILALSGVASILLGFCLVLGHTGGAFYVGTHQMVGITCICLSVIQPVYGFLRPHVGPTVQRRIFNIVHRTLGISVLVLGVLSLYLGTFLFHNHVHGWMAAVISLCLVLSLGLLAVMEFLVRTHRFNAPPVGYQKVTKDEMSDSEEEVYVKDEGEGGGTKDKGAQEEGRGAPQHEREKGILLVFVIQSFTCAAVISALLFYYD